MKNTLIKILSITAAIAMLATGCKKDDDVQVKKYTLTSLYDSTQVQNIAIDYDNQDRVLRFGVSSVLAFDYYYTGNSSNVSVRLQKNGNVVTKTDSFFYDASNRFIRMESYDENLVKFSTTTLGYNGDNSLNAMTIDYADAGDDDELYEYTYANGNVATRTEKKKISGVFKTAFVIEFLGSDNKVNPFENLYKKYFLDQVYLFYYLWSGKNNATTVKQTNYDTGTGNVTGILTGSTTYTYNADNLPTKAITIIGSNTQVLSYNYEVE